MRACLPGACKRTEQTSSPRPAPSSRRWPGRAEGRGSAPLTPDNYADLNYGCCSRLPDGRGRQPGRINGHTTFPARPACLGERRKGASTSERQQTPANASEPRSWSLVGRPSGQWLRWPRCRIVRARGALGLMKVTALVVWGQKGRAAPRRHLLSGSSLDSNWRLPWRECLVTMPRPTGCLLRASVRQSVDV